MSRIGKNPVKIPSGVTVTYASGVITVKGPKGTLVFSPHQRVKISIEKNEVIVSVAGEEKLDKSLHGLTRTLIFNMVTGVTEGFKKPMEIQGVGYKVDLKGKKLVFALGFSHPVEFELPAGISITIDKEKKNLFTIEGIDKQLVSQAAAVIRGLKPPEPYKGKGIRYQGEHIVRKVGKAATTTAK